MIVLVCGGRYFANMRGLWGQLDKLHHERPIHLVINGAAKGADTFSSQWAKRNNIQHKEYPAQWELHGRSAGPKRNALMLRDAKPDLVLAVAGGSGTADMVARAREAGVEVRDLRSTIR